MLRSLKRQHKISGLSLQYQVLEQRMWPRGRGKLGKTWGPGGDNGGAGSHCRAEGCPPLIGQDTRGTNESSDLADGATRHHTTPYPHKWWILSGLRNTIQGFRETKFSLFFAFKNVHFILMVLSWEWEHLSYTTSKLIFTLWKLLSHVWLLAAPWIYSPWIPQARIL